MLQSLWFTVVAAHFITSDLGIRTAWHETQAEKQGEGHM
jgi:hypothetical protein